MRRERYRPSEVIRRAFPDGLSSDETSALAAMPPVRRSRLEDRLRAILEYETAHARDRDVGALAASAGLRSSFFYQLLRRWSVSRSLASLGVRVGASPTRASTLGSGAAAAAARVDAIVRADPRVPTAEVLRNAMGGIDDPPSKTTLLRFVAAARRRFARGPFGEAIVFDAAGLDLVDPEGMRLRLYGVLDGGTGLVLGWGEGTWGAGAYVWVAHQAIEHLHDVELPPVPAFEGRPALDVRLEPDDAEGMALFGSVERLPPPAHASERRLGAAMVRALGDRVGGVWLGTGTRADGISFRTGRSVHLPSLTVEISDRIADGVAAHNRAVLDGLPRTGSAEAVMSALRRVRARIGEIDALPLAPADDHGT